MTNKLRQWTDPIARISLSTEGLPQHLSPSARFEAWCEVFGAGYVPVELDHLSDRPFNASFECALFGDVGVGMYEGTLSRIERTRRCVAEFTNDDLVLMFARGRTPVMASNAGRALEMAPGTCTLINVTDTGKFESGNDTAWTQFIVPGKLIAELAPAAADLVVRPFDPASPALRHLRRYAEILFGAHGAEGDADLQSIAGRTLADLLALALNPGHEGAELAGRRGLRAARLKMALVEIRKSHTDPAFSLDLLAQRLGLAPRSVQDLLQQTGVTFTERLLEQRLLAAREALTNPRFDGLKVSDVALKCGFSDVSYFNRSFRRRFGVTPGTARRR